MDLLSNNFGDLLQLFAGALNRLTNDDVKFITQQDYSELLRALFRQFSQEDWACFKQISTINADFSSYDQIAISHFGEQYLNYKNTIQVISLEELKQAVADNDIKFIDQLNKYVAGICPAFSYGVQI